MFSRRWGLPGQTRSGGEEYARAPTSKHVCTWIWMGLGKADCAGEERTERLLRADVKSAKGEGERGRKKH